MSAGFLRIWQHGTTPSRGHHAWDLQISGPSFRFLDSVGGSNALQVARAVSNGLLSENCATPSEWMGDSGVFAGVAHCAEAMP